MEARGGDVVTAPTAGYVEEVSAESAETPDELNKTATPIRMPCTAATSTGRPCGERATHGAVCAIHSGDPEAKSARMRELGAAGLKARWGAVRDTEKEELADIIAACRLDTLEACEKFLVRMAQFSVEKNNPQFMTAASNLVKTSRWVLAAKELQRENRYWRKKMGLANSPFESDPE